MRHKRSKLQQAREKVWQCFGCGRSIHFNVDMLCDDCKNQAELDAAVRQDRWWEDQ